MKKAFNRYILPILGITLLFSAVMLFLPKTTVRSDYEPSDTGESSSAYYARRDYTIVKFMDAAGIEGSSDTGVLSAFSDADSISVQYTGKVAKAVSEGIIMGYGDGTLRPDSSISRVEALAILSRIVPGRAVVRDKIEFTDIPEWAKVMLIAS